MNRDVLVCFEINIISTQIGYDLKCNYRSWYFCISNLDIDECADDADDVCDQNADCKNTEGSFTCQCQAGYTGTGQKCSGKYYSEYDKMP